MSNEYIATIADSDVFSDAKYLPPSNVFTKRDTVKAIIQMNGKFSFISNDIHKFVLLPGGGAKSDNLMEEVKRECLEELGLHVEIFGTVGRIHEFRNREGVEYDTVCFHGIGLSKSTEDYRTEEEIKNNLHSIRLSETEALEVLSAQTRNLRDGDVQYYNTSFNILRDEIFFKEYLKQMKNQ